MADRVFFAGSFRRTKFHMETQKIVGFQKKTPLPWGYMLNFRILWVLWFRSRIFFTFLGNNLISDTLRVGKTLTFKKPTLLHKEKSKGNNKINESTSEF